jgi:hypothetical protein
MILINIDDSYALTRGRVLVVHRRLVGSPMTLCGYRVATTSSTTGGRRACPQCAAYLRRVA